MKKFISLILTGTMLLSIPVMANTDYTSAIKQVKSAFTVSSLSETSKVL